MQLGGTAIFCDQFNNSNPGIASRTGGLDPNVWGVSRLSQYINPGQQMFDVFPPVHMLTCNGTQLVAPDNDVTVCNGQLREAMNDDLDGVLDFGSVIDLAIVIERDASGLVREARIALGCVAPTVIRASGWRSATKAAMSGT